MIVKSDNAEWLDLSNRWYNYASYKVDEIYNALNYAKMAVRKANSMGDIGSLSISVTETDIDEHNEKRRRIVSFCNAIHYEASELVDNPYAVKVGETNQALYDLNPSDIKVTTGKVLLWDKETSLTELISSTYTDKKLKEDFEKKSKALDKDKPSETLKDAFAEAKFWKSEFKKSAKVQEIAENVFTDDVRNNWPNMTEAERKKIIEDYATQVGEVFYGEPNWFQKVFGITPSITKVVKYDAGGFGVSRGGGEIAINPAFVKDPSGNYSVDKVIDTVTHEMRHEYQYVVKKHPKKYGAPEELVEDWKKKYYSYDPNDPNKNDYMSYYGQPVEEDAKSFAALSRPEQN